MVVCSPLPDDHLRARGRVEHAAETRADDLWNAIAGRLRATLTDTAYDTWFGEARPQSVTGGRLVVEVPNDFTRDWIEGHFHELVSRAAADTGAKAAVVSFAVSERPAARQSSAPEPAIEASQPSLPNNAPSEAVRAANESSDVELNPKYTFDLFVIGSSNRFAHAAALAVAEAPAQAYNPLFIYGGTVLGKTHLMQAIAQYVAEHSGDLSVRYVTSETFMNDFINSLRDKRIEGFKQRYRTYDLLLVDDVQFFEHKERIQEEFFHTFNSLYEAGSQIVMSSDRPPREIATLEERLRSRFEWGLITDVQPPDLETRIAILRKKVKTDQIQVADPQVLSFIASRISTNIRELEGALTRVVAFSSLTGRPLSVELAQDVLKDSFPQGEGTQISIERIQELICERFGVTHAELCSDKRSQNIVYPRQVAMYLSRELTDSSLPKIGREFGG